MRQIAAECVEGGEERARDPRERCRRRRDTWSRLGVLASVATLTVTVAACGGSGGGPGGNDNAALPDKKLEGGVKVDVAAEPTGEISIAVPADAPGDIALRRKQAEAFEAKYPKVTVKITTIPSDGYDQKILTLIAGGKAPDIFGSGDVVIPTIVNRNYALDLKPYMEADGFDTKAFYPEVIDGLTYEGKIVGLTDNWDTQVMYYNRALFQEAGRGASRPPTGRGTTTRRPRRSSRAARGPTRCGARSGRSGSCRRSTSCRRPAAPPTRRTAASAS